jgi:hypothetical protein
MKKISFYLLSILTLFVFACNQEQDTQSPVVNISDPDNNAHYAAGETFEVSGSATDDIELSSVVLSIHRDSVDGDMVYERNLTDVSGVRHDFNEEVMIEESGHYFVVVTATDNENNRAMSSVEVNIHGDEGGVAEGSTRFMVTVPDGTEGPVYWVGENEQVVEMSEMGNNRYSVDIEHDNLGDNTTYYYSRGEGMEEVDSATGDIRWRTYDRDNQGNWVNDRVSTWQDDAGE